MSSASVNLGSTVNSGGGGSSGITSLTTDVTASGPGAAVATLSTIVNKRYIDFASGNDTNTGTIVSPWKTLQHAYNSITPSLTTPYVFYLSGGNDSSDSAPITAKPNVSLISDYLITLFQSFTISGGATSDNATFTNVFFGAGFTWNRNDSSSITAQFNGCGVLGATLKQNGAGAFTVQGNNTTFLNLDLLAPGGSNNFIGCVFIGNTVIEDVSSNVCSFFGGSLQNALTISGNVSAIFSGVNDGNYTLTTVNTANGSPSITSDCSSVPGSITGPNTLAFNSFVQYINYTPGNSGNWNGNPGLVQQALDRMASLLKTLNSGTPIP